MSSAGLNGPRPIGDSFFVIDSASCFSCASTDKFLFFLGDLAALHSDTLELWTRSFINLQMPLFRLHLSELSGRAAPVLLPWVAGAAHFSAAS